MAYEDQQETNRVVVNQPVVQPPVQREYVQTESVYVPAETRGISGLAVAAIVIGAVALVTVLFMVYINSRDAANSNAQAVARENSRENQQPIVVQQPAPQQQQPIVVQQPAAPAAAPIVVQQPPANTAAGSPDWDSYIQSEFDRRMSVNPDYATLAVTASALAGKVTLKGSVPNAMFKSDLEKMVRDIKGVKSIDNQLEVSPN